MHSFHPWVWFDLTIYKLLPFLHSPASLSTSWPALTQLIKNSPLQDSNEHLQRTKVKLLSEPPQEQVLSRKAEASLPSNPPAAKKRSYWCWTTDASWQITGQESPVHRGNILWYMWHQQQNLSGPDQVRNELFPLHRIAADENILPDAVVTCAAPSINCFKSHLHAPECFPW